MGGQLFGVKRVWPARTYEDKLGEPFTVTAELREIALRVARAFGTDLFGLDIVVSDGRPYVVDINPFPGFKGVPDAALRLADYLYTAVRRAVDARQLAEASA
jgi:glutathione synthase/RimK-type ligase-like ATP-grasp enzyme